MSISLADNNQSNAIALTCQGEWTLKAISQIENQFQALKFPEDQDIHIDASAIQQFDSAGAWLLQKMIHRLTKHGFKVQLDGLSPLQSQLHERIAKQKSMINKYVIHLPIPNWVYRLGKKAYIKFRQCDDFIVFIGKIIVNTLENISNIARFSWTSVFTTIDDAGWRALPIIALLSFLIGIVLAYQLGLQLQMYGADAFIVNFSGMAILREFAPLITAIIVAGRTSSAITAQIGLMKVNEEIDALRTMGISPINRLVLPKIIGMLIVMPILILWADLFGVLGSMVMSKNMLNIGYMDFLTRFPKVIDVNHYLVGISKAPAFAMIIATVGCFQGFQVSMDADSVGRQTTRSVVQAIFLIIISDALSSIYFSWANI